MLLLDLHAVYVVRDCPDQVLTNDFGSQPRENLLGVLWNVFEPIQLFNGSDSRRWPSTAGVFENGSYGSYELPH